MKFRKQSLSASARRVIAFSRISVCALILTGVACAGFGQETVTIPKARLQELERKEAELDKIKGELNRASGENQRLKKQHQEDAAKIESAASAAPVITHTSPALASLPPLQDHDLVDAMDLANYYRADAAEADRRFRKRIIRLQGEVVAFEKPLFIRPYRIIFKTADREIRIVCDVYPPEKYDAVLTAKHGSVLEGQMPGGSRIHLAKVGDRAIVEGQCTGLSDMYVKLSGCQLQAVQSP